MTLSKKKMIFAMANRLLEANNTVTTLEIKTELRQKYPNEKWYQDDISDVMDDFAGEGLFKFKSEPGGMFRIYSAFKVAAKATPGKPIRISKTKALELIGSTNSKFFTMIFVKKDGTERTINCRFKGKPQISPLGYLSVIDVAKQRKDPNDCRRQVNLQTLKKMRIFGQDYIVL